MKREIKYSFLMPYYDRGIQLNDTLSFLLRMYIGRQARDDFEIIIVEDQKNVQDCLKHKELTNIVSWHSKFIPIIHLKDSYTSFNSCTKYNIAANIAKGEYFIITNPECILEVDVLSGFDKEFEKNPNVYVVCACRSLDSQGAFHRWYQHSIHRNACYHFCSVISKDNYFKIGGFDEEYKDGYCFDDDDFRDTIVKAGIPFIVRDDLLVSHQWHSKAYRPPNWKQLWERNKAIYEKKFGKYTEWL